MLRFLVVTISLSLTSCGPPIEDHIEGLGNSSGEDLTNARNELLLARQKAIAPLLKALDDPRHAAARPEIASLLADLLNRLGDERIAPALRRHLITDPDGRVRARIALEVGMYGRPEFAGTFLQALSDTMSQVRAHAIAGLSRIKSELSTAQLDSLLEAARLLQSDESRAIRMEAGLVIDKHVDGWLRDARGERLKGMIAEAESLYCEALTFAPGHRKAGRELGMLHLENGQEKRGLQILRETGWLLDVPRAPTAPLVDGHLDDEVWHQAGSIGPLYTYGYVSMPTLESPYPTRVRVLYTDEALYFGIHCEDAHPESLFVVSSERDHQGYPNQDLIEVVIDPEFDHLNIIEIAVNSAAAIIDARQNRDRTWDFSWNIVSEAAVHVGADHWSIEWGVPFGVQPEIPIPKRGDWWGVRVLRAYRNDVERSGWSDYYHDDTDQTYGWFLFQ